MNKKKALAILLVFTLFLGVITPAMANTINSPFDLFEEISTGMIDNFTNIVNKSAEYFKNVVAKFTDMGNHWSDEVVGKLVELGAIGGYGDGSFKPNNPITRAEFSKILNTSLRLGTVTTEAFTDTVNHWSKDNINTLAHYGIIEKSEYGTNYQPDKNITRIEIAKMIVRAAGLNEDAKAKAGQHTGFGDNASIKTSDKGYVIIAKDNKLIGGYPDNTFQPNNNATRAEASAMIIRTLEMINNTEEQPEEEIKEEPKPVVSNLPDSLEFGRYTDEENYILYIKNYKNYFTYGYDYSFKTTCINRPDLNSFKVLKSDGKVVTYRKDEWKSFNGASGEEDNTRRLYQLRFKDSKYIFIDPYMLKDDVQDGEVLEFEVQARYNPTGEVKTYYTSYVW